MGSLSAKRRPGAEHARGTPRPSVRPFLPAQAKAKGRPCGQSRRAAYPLSQLDVNLCLGRKHGAREERSDQSRSGPIKLKKRVAPSSVANNGCLVLLRDRRSFPWAQKSLVPQLTPSVSCLGCRAVCLHAVPLVNIIVLKDRLPYMVYAHGGLSHRAPRPQQVVPDSSVGQSPPAGWVPEPCDRLSSNSVPSLITRCTFP